MERSDRDTDRDTKRQKNNHTPKREIRISDEVWDKLKQSKKKGATWNLYLSELVELSTIAKSKL